MIVKNKRQLYLVVKCGNAKKNNAAEELIKVINKHGYSWFGKLGAPIKPTRFIAKTEDEELFLSLAIFIDGRYNLTTFKISNLQAGNQKTNKIYPKYYKEFIDQISTWIRVESSNISQPKIEELIVRSSLNPISIALKTSTCGHFICKKK